MLKAVATESLASSGITVGVSVITGGTNTRVLFDDSGVVGESAGLTYVKASGLLASTVMAIGGATIGANALAVTGTSAFSDNIVTQGAVTAGDNISISAATGVFRNTGRGTTLSSPSGGVWQSGAADAAVAVAQTLRVQSVVAGTADTAGANWTFNASVSTGAGVPGKIILKGVGKGAASTVQNTLITALTITDGTTNNTNVGYPSVVVGSGAAVGTTATDGFLYIPTCAGTPTGVPTSQTGAIPMVYDTTNHQFWFYDSGWKQPKTPAAAAIITWQ